MNQDDSRMVLSGEALAEVLRVHSAVVEDFLCAERIKPNVVGMGVGVKWTDGKPTGKPALVVMVTQKLAKNQLSEDDLIPQRLKGIQTDVLTAGYPMAGGGRAADVKSQALARSVRPVKGGWSVGHYRITAGTIGTCVYDILPGGKVSPPNSGIGIPSAYYILSNNHILANSNDANLGDPILQPGPFDGGIDPTDRIAFLTRFVPITFEPQTPRVLHNNVVDAAAAEGEFYNLDREIHWIGRVRGWRRKADVKVGTMVQKTGRTTNYTVGRITAVKATVDVGYGNGKMARFKDQIVTTNISKAGDSGSLVTTLDNVAVGLLFAGSSQVTIVNQIENVRSLLRVEVAEQIL